MDSLYVRQYLDMAARRKWWVIIPFLLVVLAGLTYAMVTPEIYRAQTLILVQPQKVPEDFVRSIVSTTAEDRLRTISQQVTSRTNLEKIIKEYKPFDSPNNNMLLDDKVALLRTLININVSGGHSRRGGSETNAFTISFRDKDPRKAMEVTNALASNFITQNLKIRESQAMGTSSFLADELDSVEKKLMKKEEVLKEYRERYMGGLPEQLQTNLSILERLQGQLTQLQNNLRDAENRKILVQGQIAEQENGGGVGILSRQSSRAQGPRDLVSLKGELASLESRYTQNHPDVIRLKKMIAELEGKKSGQNGEGPPVSSVDQTLRHQLQDIGLEINNLKGEIIKAHSQIEAYQEKVEETPKREQELLSLNRDYKNLKELYNSLLNRKLEAQIAVSMESKQKGEQFLVVDPAKVPQRPVEPDFRKIFLLTLVLGLGIGCGLAYLLESMDTSYKSPDEVEKELQLPILVSMPFRYTQGELRNMKIKGILAMASVTVGFFVAAFVIVLATKGMDSMANFIENIFIGV